MKNYNSLFLILLMVCLFTNCEKEIITNNDESNFEIRKGKPVNGNGSCTNTLFCFQLVGNLSSEASPQYNCVGSKSDQFVMSTSAAQGNEPFYFNLSGIAGSCTFGDNNVVKGTFSVSKNRDNTAKLNSFFNFNSDGSGVGYELIAEGGIINGAWFPGNGEITEINFNNVPYELKRQGKGKGKNDICINSGIFDNLTIILKYGSCD
jgi:hypothetical protein